jgi:predicted metal-binding membrane protein
MIAGGTDRPRTALEVAVSSDMIAPLLTLVAVALTCWAWIGLMAHDMYGPMTGASRWMMRATWNARYVSLVWAMWAAMMTGMMLPSAGPTIVMFGAAMRRRRGTAAPLQIYALAAGYLVVWAGFSIAATALQRALATALFVSPMLEILSPRLAAALLVMAGAYQLTPLKQTCLRTCQSPLGFLLRHWREGVGGAFHMGVRHGLYCLGCCWALMLLLFVGGVMNVIAIGALTIFVAVEKFGMLGRQGARVSGALLVLMGLWIFVR